MSRAFFSFRFICSTVLFADPTDEEENLLTGVVTVVVTDDDKIAAVHKPGENKCPPPKCTYNKPFANSKMAKFEAPGIKG